jgi:hypothetical protein
MPQGSPHDLSQARWVEGSFNPAERLSEAGPIASVLEVSGKARFLQPMCSLGCLESSHVAFPLFNRFL